MLHYRNPLDRLILDIQLLDRVDGPMIGDESLPVLALAVQIRMLTSHAVDTVYHLKHTPMRKPPTRACDFGPLSCYRGVGYQHVQAY